ncbi:MAG: histidine phosphatase family protein [Candidatus Hermodarchaeota archaeon]
MDLKNISVDLYLIRHADPAGLPNHWTTINTPLSDLGIKQAQNVAQRLKNHSLDVLITSPLTRAKQTAEIIQKAYQNDLRLQVQAWLAEIDLGDLGGIHKSIVRQQFPNLPIVPPKDIRFPAPLVARLLCQNKEFSFPSGENLKEFWERVSKGFSLVIRQFIGTIDKKIGLVGHGGSFTVIVLTLLGKTVLDNKFPIFFFNKGDFTLIRIVNGQILFLQVNPALIPENKPK